MAFRNLRKNKRRTWITLFSIGFGLLLAMTFTGIGDSGYTKMINGAARLGSGHLSIVPSGYIETPALDKTIQDTEEKIALLKKYDHIDACVVRIQGQAMVATPRDSGGATFVALDPGTETSDTAYFLEYIKEGKLFDRDDTFGIVIGRTMSDRLKVGIGEKIVYTTTDKHGEITSGLARVSGIFESGSKEVDGYFIILPLNRMRDLLGYNNDEATLLAIFLDDHHRSEHLKNRLQSEMNDSSCEVTTWRETMPDMASFVALDSSMNYLFQIIIFLLIAAGILNTILMSVLERTRELGIMLAIGMSPVRVVGLIMAEAFWLGILGIVSGIIITAPLYYYLHIFGIDFSGLIHEDTDVAGVVFDSIIYNDLRLESFLFIITGAFIITLLSGIYPAWKAGRLAPVESIKTI
ncbi:ABC transporter permease [bacterium]|nr:ABC transporter permease [candidate division CSSED10-310 bacterium]